MRRRKRKERKGKERKGKGKKRVAINKYCHAHFPIWSNSEKKTDDEINAGDRKYIKCTFIEAKELMDVSKNGRPEPVIDAYIFTSLGSGHKVSKEEYITKSNKQTLTPAWRGDVYLRQRIRPHQSRFGSSLDY